MGYIGMEHEEKMRESYRMFSKSTAHSLNRGKIRVLRIRGDITKEEADTLEWENSVLALICGKPVGELSVSK